MNSLYFDTVVKIVAKEEHVMGVFDGKAIIKGGGVGVASEGAVVCYTTYYGFTARGWHFSKKRFSLYPLKIIGEKSEIELDLEELESLKHIPPQIGDYIMFKPGDSNKTVTWCHATPMARQLFHALKNDEHVAVPINEQVQPNYLQLLDIELESVRDKYNFDTEYVIV